MDLFKLLGKFKIDGAEKAKQDIKDVSSAAEKTSGVFGRFGQAFINAFKNEKVEAFGVSLVKLNSRITSQTNELGVLKQKYMDLYLTQGKNSDEAKECANEISKLSKELQTNKTKLSEAEKAADKLDNSLDEVNDSAKELSSGGFSVLKGAAADLISSSSFSSTAGHTTKHWWPSATCLRIKALIRGR